MPWPTLFFQFLEAPETSYVCVKNKFVNNHTCVLGVIRRGASARALPAKENDQNALKHLAGIPEL